MNTTLQPNHGPQNIRLSLALNIILPVVLYTVLRHFHFSYFTALAYSSVVPTFDTISTWLRHKQFDCLGMISAGSIALQLLASGLLTSNSVLLKADGLLTVAPLGIAFIISALIDKPLLTLLRQTILSAISGPQAEQLAARKPSQRKMVIISLVIGSALVLYAAVNLALAIILPPANFPTVSRDISWGAIALCVGIVSYRKKRAQQAKGVKYV
jgi:hypothetical protein